jgi:hypothetical protein
VDALVANNWFNRNNYFGLFGLLDGVLLDIGRVALNVEFN